MGESKKVESNILIWSDLTGFVKIREGNGSNLYEEDVEKGFVDYIMMDFADYDGDDLEDAEGAQIMLTEMYQDMFQSVDDVIQYLVDTNWLPIKKYTILYAE